MRKFETPIRIKYWDQVDGTIIEELYVVSLPELKIGYKEEVMFGNKRKISFEIMEARKTAKERLFGEICKSCIHFGKRSCDKYEILVFINSPLTVSKKSLKMLKNIGVISNCAGFLRRV